MPSRLILALALSLAVHASLLLPGARLFGVPPQRPLLEASLQLPPPPGSSDALLKNTLAADEPPVKHRPPAPSASRAAPPLAKAAPRHQIEAAQRKLSQHLYYPPEAVARGIEGEVRLILILAEDGSITEVNIASSSGHPLLDKAAVKAAYAMGSVNWAHSREMILPVIFRLE